MPVVHAILGLAFFVQPPTNRSEPKLDVRAERGVGGVQGDGWQHIALRLENTSGQPISGRATLYEWESQVGARPRVVLPFAVTDRQVLHFYPFRAPESPQPSTFVITLEDESGNPIQYDGASQFVIHGQSTRALRVETGGIPSGDFRIGIWGEPTPFMRNLVNEWTPMSSDQLNELIRRGQVGRQLSFSGSGRVTPESFVIDQPRMLPDSFVGYGDTDVLMLMNADLDRELSEKQRRVLGDWIHSGGFVVFVPHKREHLDTPFWRDLAGIRSPREVTAPDDKHLSRWIASEAGPPHQPVHFLSVIDPERPVETTASFLGDPVVYSVPAGYGRVWVVAFNPDSHGGAKRYKPLWIEILNQAMRHRITDGRPPTSIASHAWSPQNDQQWLTWLGERFGNSPKIENLAGLILCYLLIIGPVNYFVLKRREARVWLIATVPCLAVIFGVVVLTMGYVSHGMRAATNQIALAVVTPEGDRAFVEEYVGVYGTTSADYRLGFPRNLPVRPLGEFVANPNGGFDNPASFKLASEEDRVWLEDWRLTFWQTRGSASLDCVPLGGQLRSVRNGREITVSNQTAIEFELITLMSGSRHPIGALRPFESRTVTLALDPLGDENGRDLLPSFRVGVPGTRPKSSISSTTSKSGGLSNKGEEGLEQTKSSSDLQEDSLEVGWLEAQHLVEIAGRRLNQRNSEWVLGITKQPAHQVDSPDTKRQLITTLYAWPIVSD